MYIDFTGQKLTWINGMFLRPWKVEVFVAILGCNQLTYVEAVANQKKEDLIRACENSLIYLREYLWLLCPITWATVTKGSKYEAVLNGVPSPALPFTR